jgi:hypothetical protein
MCPSEETVYWRYLSEGLFKGSAIQIRQGSIEQLDVNLKNASFEPALPTENNRLTKPEKPSKLET